MALLMSVATFRALMPAFADVVKWPDEVIEMALCEAEAETGGRGWGAYDDECSNFRNRGIRYYAAHWLSSMYGYSGADASNVKPDARQNVSAKSVGDESLQYRITEMENTTNDWLSTTIYGTQYVKLRNRAGMGARVV